MTQQSLNEIIESRGLSRYQVLVIAMCGLVALLDGFDTQSVAFVVPLIAKEWELPLSAFGPVFAAGLLGGLIGAVVFGSVADRFGRRITLLVTVALFAAGSLITPLVDSQLELTLIRLLTGLGLGGALPSIISLTAEYSPGRSRATLVTAMFCGFPLGAVVGAVGSAPLIAAFGWKSVFIAGGLIPLLLLPLLAWIMPESIAWLRRRGRADEIGRILERMGGRENCDGNVSDVAEGHPSVAITAPFQQGRALGTVLFAWAFFVSLLGVYLLVSWVPTIAAQAGHSIKASIMAAAVLNLTGIIGSLLIARANDRLNPYRVVSGAFALGALGILILALTFDVGAAIFPFTIVAGLLCIGAQVSLVSLASAFYPVEVRARGLGILMAAGRVGAIAGPLVGGIFIDKSGAGEVLAYVIGSAFFLAGPAVFLSRRSSPVR